MAKFSNHNCVFESSVSFYAPVFNFNQVVYMILVPIPLPASAYLFPTNPFKSLFK